MQYPYYTTRSKPDYHVKGVKIIKNRKALSDDKRNTLA